MRNFLKTIVAKLNTPKVTGNTAVVENMEGRQLFAATPVAYEMGVAINNNDSALNDKAIPLLKAIGCNAVRVWINPGAFTKRNAFLPAMNMARKYKAAGFHVIAEVTAPNGTVTNAEAVKGWFNFIIGTDLKNAVDSWEIGNETEYAHYWQGTPKQYVDNFLKPASEVLRPAGEKVISAGPSWDTLRVKQFISYGILNMVDAIAYHPYANSVNLVKQRISEIKTVVAGRKPIIASEWTVRGFSSYSMVNGVKVWKATNLTAWAAATAQIYPQIKANFAENYYFAAFASSKTMAAPGGLITEGGSPTVIYNAIKGVRNTPGTLIAGPTVLAKASTSATFSTSAIDLIGATSATAVL